MRTLIGVLLLGLALPGPALAAANGQIAVSEPGIGTLDPVAHDPFLGATQSHMLSADGREPDWSPDGNQIVYAGTGGIFVVDVPGGGIQRVTSTPGGEHDLLPDWTADGSRIVFLRSDNGYVQDAVMTVTPGAPEQATGTMLPGDTYDIDWSPDGRYARTTTGHELAVGTLGGTETVIAHDAGGGPAWSPDGTTLAFAGFGYAALIPAAGGDVTPLTAPTSHTIAHVDFSPDGRKVIYDDHDPVSHGAASLEVVTIADRTVQIVGSSHAGGLSQPAWQPCIAGVTVSCVANPAPPAAPRLTSLATPKLDRHGRARLTARCDVKCTISLRVSATLRGGHVIHGRIVKRTVSAGTTMHVHLSISTHRRVKSARIAGTVTGLDGLHRSFTSTLKR